MRKLAINGTPVAIPSDGMEVTEIAVIYLACGAPVAVYQFLRFRRESFQRKWLTPVAVLLLWPAAGLILLTRSFCKKRFITQFEKSFELDAAAKYLVAELKSSLSNTTEAPVFHVRDVVDRYVGLTRIRLYGLSRRSSVNLLRAAGRTDIETSLRCFDRRNASRIERHQTDAGMKFVALIRNSASSEILNKALGLAELLCDAATIRELSAIKEEITVTHKVGIDLWNSEQQHSPNEHSPVNIQKLATATGSSKND